MGRGRKLAWCALQAQALHTSTAMYTASNLLAAYPSLGAHMYYASAQGYITTVVREEEMFDVANLFQDDFPMFDSLTLWELQRFIFGT